MNARSPSAELACFRASGSFSKPVRLGSRALDILIVLAENAGRVVPKEELIAGKILKRVLRERFRDREERAAN